MKTVITHGFKEYKTECFTCGCIFTYEVDDIKRNKVACPDCGHNVDHYPSDHTRNSQIEG